MWYDGGGVSVILRPLSKGAERDSKFYLEMGNFWEMREVNFEKIWLGGGGQRGKFNFEKVGLGEWEGSWKEEGLLADSWPVKMTIYLSLVLSSTCYTVNQ